MKNVLPQLAVTASSAPVASSEERRVLMRAAP